MIKIKYIILLINLQRVIFFCSDSNKEDEFKKPTGYKNNNNSTAFRFISLLLRFNKPRTGLDFFTKSIP